MVSAHALAVGMTYATLFLPEGRLGLSLDTDEEGGPFLCEYFAKPSRLYRNDGARAGEQLLWRHVRKHAPGVFAKARALGWVPPPISVDTKGKDQ